MFDFTKVAKIDSVIVFGREVDPTDPGVVSQSANLLVYVGNSSASGGQNNVLCSTVPLNAVDNGTSVGCGLAGQFVSVYRVGNFFSFCEVRIIGLVV
jgi:hypothetical protein